MATSQSLVVAERVFENAARILDWIENGTGKLPFTISSPNSDDIFVMKLSFFTSPSYSRVATTIYCRKKNTHDDDRTIFDYISLCEDAQNPDHLAKLSRRFALRLTALELLGFVLSLIQFRQAEGLGMVLHRHC